MDSSKGIVYYDDINCQWKKIHNTGFKNLYSVTVYFVRIKDGDDTNTVVRKTFTYGDFKMAYRRYNTEMNLCRREDKTVEVNLNLVSLNGLNIVMQEELLNDWSNKFDLPL